MENPRPEKVAVVDEVRERFSASSAALLTEYRGLDVAQMAALRRSLRDAGGSYKIYKNTLARRAAADAGLVELLEWLEGPVAIAFVRPEGDAVVAAKALRDFARTNPNLVLKGGMLGPRILTVRDVETLADVPPRAELLARLANGFQAPLVKAAGLFQAFTRNFAYGLKAYIDTRPTEESRSETAPPGAPDEGESDQQAPPSAEPTETPEQEPAATETQEEEAN